ncbi:GAF domain-containing protein [bacterium]|nr:GAF domain-containing protein [bacterium]
MVFVENDVKKEFRELFTLSKISEAMSQDHTIDEFLNFVINTLQQEIDIDILMIEAFDPENNTLEFEKNFGVDEDTLQKYKKNFPDQIAWSISQKEPLLLVDILDSEVLEKCGLKTLIIQPLITKDKNFGHFLIGRKKGTNFIINDLEMFSVVASQISHFIEAYKLKVAQEDKIRELNKLNEIGQLLNSSLHKSEVLDIISSSLKEMINVDISALLFTNEDQTQIITVLSSPISDELLEQAHEEMLKSFFILGQQEIDRNSIEYQVIYSKAYEHREHVSNLKSFLTVPIIIRGIIRGLISVIHHHDNYFLRDNRRTISTFASQIAIALDNAIIYENMQRKIEEMYRIGEISQALTSTLEIEQILSVLLEATAKLLKVRICELRLIDKESGLLKVKATTGLSSNPVQRVELRIGEGVLGLVALDKEPVIIEDGLSDYRVKYRKFIVKEKLKSLLAVPLCIKDKVIGVMSVYSNRIRKYKKYEVELLETISSHAATALENAKLYSFMQENYLSTVTALSAAVDAKDHYTHGHSEQVMEISVSIAQELGISKKDVELIKFAGLLHDIGKIGISDTILQKNGKLTDEEFHQISQHPVLGSSIIGKIEFLKNIQPLTYHHHEKWDGTGYPSGLSGNNIPIGARILAVADTYDALTSDRVYRKGCSRDVAIEEILRCSGTQFDPGVVNAFIKVVNHESYSVRQHQYNYYIDDDIFEVL